MPLRIVQVEKAEMEKVGGNCLSFRSIHAKTEHTQKMQIYTYSKGCGNL